MKYDAITLDTNIFTKYQYGLESKLLELLSQFKDGPVKFVLSEIVEREVQHHIVDENDMYLKGLDKQINDTKRHKLLTEDTVNQIKVLIAADTSPKRDPKKRWQIYILNTGAEIIPSKGCDVANLVDKYFLRLPPFGDTDKKKYEFPDAIALMSLESWAQLNNKKILAISNDHGWVDFCHSSEYIDLERELGKGLALLQSYTEEFEGTIEEFLNTLDLNQNLEIREQIRLKISSSFLEMDVNAFADTDCSLDADSDGAELEYTGFEVHEPISFSIIQSNFEAVVIKIHISIEVNASAYFFLYGMNIYETRSILLGGCSKSIETQLESDLLLSIQIDSSTTKPKLIKVDDINVINSIDSVDFGTIYTEHEVDWNQEYWNELYEDTE